MNRSLKKPCSGEKEREERAESRLVPLFDRRAPGFAKQTDGDVRKAKHTTSLVKLPERSGLRICKALKLFFSGERPLCTDTEHTANSFRTPAKHIIFTFDLEHTRLPPGRLRTRTGQCHPAGQGGPQSGIFQMSKRSETPQTGFEIFSPAKRTRTACPDPQGHWPVQTTCGSRLPKQHEKKAVKFGISSHHVILAHQCT